MSRPPSANTRHFRRMIGEPEQQILCAAGEGNTTVGFNEILSVYRHFFNQGLRPGMPLERIAIIIPLGKAGRPVKDLSQTGDFKI